MSAELLSIRTQLAQASPEERQVLLRRQAALERRKESLAGRESDAQVAEVVTERRAAARAAAKARAEAKAAREKAAAIIPLSIPSSVPVPVAATATTGGDLAAAIDGYLAGKLSPLAGLGSTFVAEAQAVGLDPRFLVAISGGETSFGTYGPAQAIHNPFGLGPHKVFATWPDAIRYAAQNLAGPLYLGDGRVTIPAIQQRWAPVGATNDPTNLNSNWLGTIGRFYAELGGDPNGSVFRGVAAPAAAPQAAQAPAAEGAQAQAETVAAPLAQGPAVSVPGGGTGLGPQIAQDALQFLGVPYLWGGTTPGGFDCSGIVQYLYAQRGVILPRVAEAQSAVGIPVAPRDLRAGDAIFFADSTGYIHHEGMYLGGGYFIHAPHTGDVVKISSLYEPYYAGQYAGARRY